MAKNDSYNDELKQTIIRLFNAGRKIQDLAKEYGIPESTVRYWTVDKPKREAKSKIENSDEQDLKNLKKEIARLKEENEILKKAMTIFAKS